MGRIREFIRIRIKNMIQCATVLSKIQPVQRRVWEKVCWKNLYQHGYTCSKEEMKLAINRLISKELVDIVGGYCKLTSSLEEILYEIHRITEEKTLEKIIK